MHGAVLSFATSRQWVYEYLFGPHYFDTRTQSWPLTSPRAAVMVVALYLACVPLARSMMAERKPVDVRTFVTWHNVAMMLLSLWMFVATLRFQGQCEGWGTTSSRVWGTVTDPSKTGPTCMSLARVLYVHYLSKIVEFTDTFVMILKRNDRQISFLHIYHHASTFICWWFAINFTPGGDPYFICTLNSLVHVVMYSYYLVSGLKRFQIPVTVKKSITVMQMVQFAFFFIQALYGVFYATWYRPRIIVALSLSQAVIFTTLFGNFFLKTYTSRGQKEAIARRKAAKLATE